MVNAGVLAKTCARCSLATACHYILQERLASKHSYMIMNDPLAYIFK